MAEKVNLNFGTTKPNTMNTKNVTLNDVIITPLTCAAFVMEFIKLIIHDRVQIPYPYSWLKYKVTKRQQVELNDAKATNKALDRYFKIAATALEFLENLSKSLHREFTDPSAIVNEVIVGFGPTMATLSETYSLQMPDITHGHAEVNHLMDMNKTATHIVRNIFFNNEMLHSKEVPLPPTNMHVLLKKRYSSPDATRMPTSCFFLPKDAFHIPRSCLRFNITFNCASSKRPTCCSNLEIFEDIGGRSSSSQQTAIHQVNTPTNLCNVECEKWFQMKTVLKGYKDTYVNSRSVADIW